MNRYMHERTKSVMLCPRDLKSSATAFLRDDNASRTKSNGSSLAALVSASPLIKALRRSLVCETDLCWATYTFEVSISLSPMPEREKSWCKISAITPWQFLRKGLLVYDWQRGWHLLLAFRECAKSSYLARCRALVSRER